MCESRVRTAVTKVYIVYTFYVVNIQEATIHEMVTGRRVTINFSSFVFMVTSYHVAYSVRSTPDTI